MKSIFNKIEIENFIDRLNQLKPDSQPLWGKMSAVQMLAHCNVTYEMLYEDKHPKPGFLMKLMLKAFVKNSVVNEKMYPKNSRTAPQFIISDHRNFENEKLRLINFMKRTQEEGSESFEGKESHSFGKLTSQEWNNMMVKHLEHHFGQFGI